jgi:hypothetical protein
VTRFSRRLIASAVAIAIAGATYFAIRPWTKSTAATGPAALLLVDAKPLGTLPAGPLPTPGEIETNRRTVVALVKSEIVIISALRDPSLRAVEDVRKRPDAVAWLTERLTADFPEGSSVLRIGVTGVPPKDAALLANAVAGSFRKMVVEMELKSLNERRQAMEMEKASLLRTLDQQKQELHRIAASTGAPPNAADHRAFLASLYRERAGLRLELSRMRGEKGAVSDAGTREKRSRDELTALDEQIKSCERADLDLARAEVARLEAGVGGVSAEITRIERDQKLPSRVQLLAFAEAPGSDDVP